MRMCLSCGKELRAHEEIWCPPCLETVMKADFKVGKRATPICSYDGIGSDGKVIRGEKCYCALPEKN